MTGRGRRAALPPDGHRAEPALGPCGLVVRVVNKAGYLKELLKQASLEPATLRRLLVQAGREIDGYGNRQQHGRTHGRRGISGRPSRRCTSGPIWSWSLSVPL